MFTKWYTKVSVIWERERKRERERERAFTNVHKMVHKNICNLRERERERERERAWAGLHVQWSRENPSRYICTDILLNKALIFEYLDMIVRIYLSQLKPNETLFSRNKRIKVNALVGYFAHLCWALFKQHVFSKCQMVLILLIYHLIVNKRLSFMWFYFSLFAYILCNTNSAYELTKRPLK